MLMKFYQFSDQNLPSLGKMWQLIPVILCVTYVQAHRFRQPLNSPYQGGYINNERNVAPGYYPGQMAVENPYYAVKQYPEYSAIAQPANSYHYPGQRQTQYNDDPYLNAPYNKPQAAYGYYPAGRANNLRQARKPMMFGPEIYNFDLDDVSDSELDDSKSASDEQSYFDDLELVENFGNYLKRRTQLDPSSGAVNDAAHQYNALLAVIIALAKIVRNSCADFEQMYEQIYQSTVDTYYKYGLANAEKVSVMMEEYIRKGNSHMPRLKRLKQELCEKDVFCSQTVDSKIKSSPLLYVKELETLDALAHLARKYYPYIEEFNQAAQKGAVLPYLQNSKDRLKEYIMHVVNSVEHLTDKAVRCM